MIILLSINSTAFAGTDDTANKDTGGITVWQTFFMLLTVIPVSKMLSSIFMKLVARVGTVDEDKWAMIGLGAIGATVSLMKRGGGINNLKSNITKGMTTGGGTPGMRNISTPGAANINGGVGGGTPGQMSINSQAASSQPSGIPGVTLTPVTGTTGTQQTPNSPLNSASSPLSPGQIPETGQRNLNDILNLSGSVGSKSAGIAAKVGAASAFAVPEVAPVTAGIYAATTKGIVGMGSTLNNLQKEVKTRSKENNQSWGQSLMQITGTNNRVTATTKTLSALALSPFGSRVSTYGTGMLDKGFQKTGNAVQKVRSKINKP